MASPKDFTMPLGGCFDEPGDCVYVWCCPCFAFKDAAENIGDENGMLYCLATCPFCFGCCALTILGSRVAEKGGIGMGMPQSALCSYFSSCTCYACRVYNESKLIKIATSAPAESDKMDRE